MDGLPSASSPYFYGTTLEQNFPTGNLCWRFAGQVTERRASAIVLICGAQANWIRRARRDVAKEAKPDRQVVTAAFPVCVDEVIE
jgi:hypothetical protein